MGASARRPATTWIAPILMLLLTTLVTWWLVSLAISIWALALWVLALAWWLYRWVRPGWGGLEIGPGWGIIWVAAVLTLLAAVKNVLATPHGLQGRFLFPSIGALSLLMAAGWFALFPPRLAAYLPHLTVGLMVSLNLLLWWGGVLPVYYQPFLD